jgi:hypothetical protein
MSIYRMKYGALYITIALCWLGHPLSFFKGNDFLCAISGQKWTIVSTLTKFAGISNKSRMK